MNGRIMDINNLDINVFARNILADKKYLNQAYSKYISNCYEIDNVTGVITAENLKMLIIKARKNKKLCKMLNSILWYISENSITDENFNLLLKFPRKAMRSYAFVLSHSELSFYQMSKLNENFATYESFVWLFNNMCKYECFSVYDMMNLLNSNRNIKTEVIGDLIYSCIEMYGLTVKLQQVCKLYQYPKEIVK